MTLCDYAVSNIQTEMQSLESEWQQHYVWCLFSFLCVSASVQLQYLYLMALVFTAWFCLTSESRYFTGTKKNWQWPGGAGDSSFRCDGEHRGRSAKESHWRWWMWATVSCTAQSSLSTWTFQLVWRLFDQRPLDSDCSSPSEARRVRRPEQQLKLVNPRNV